MAGHREERTVIRKRWTSRDHRLPLQPLIHNKVHDTSILLDQPMRELPIPPQLRGHAVEAVDSVDTCMHQTPLQDSRYTTCLLIKCRTSSQLNLVYSESGVPMMLRSFSPSSFRKSGHSAGHWSRGTLTSQKGSGSSCGMAVLVRRSAGKGNESAVSWYVLSRR